MDPARTLFITERGAERAAAIHLQGHPKAAHAEIIRGLVRSPDKSIERGWFVKLSFVEDGRGGAPVFL